MLKQQELKESTAIAAEKERREKITTKKKDLYNAERQTHWNSHAARLNELNAARLNELNESKNNESKNNESKEESPSELRLVF